MLGFGDIVLPGILVRGNTHLSWLVDKAGGERNPNIYGAPGKEASIVVLHKIYRHCVMALSSLCDGLFNIV
jgi:hypothetical protein